MHILIFYPILCLVSSKTTDLDPSNSENVLLIYGYDDTDNNTLTDQSRDKNNNDGY